MKTLKFVLLGLAMISASVPAQAQSVGELFGNMIQDSVQSSKMKKACLNQQFAVNYAVYMMGYELFDTGGGSRSSIEKRNALAKEIIDRATISEWSFKGWTSDGHGGRCSMFFAMKLAPEDAAHFNNDPIWGGDVTVGLAKQDGQWKVASFTDSGSKAAVSGWLASWMQERDRQPGGAPRLATPLPPLPPAQLASKLRYARSCGSHWLVSDDLFPAYNAWLDMVNDAVLLNFKVSTGAYLENGRLVSSSNSEIVCRYDISTGTLGGFNPNKSIRNLDMRFTIVGGRPKWEVLSFPNSSIADYSQAQVDQLASQTYINGQAIRQWSAAQSKKPAQPQPRNVVEALAQAQSQYDAEAEAYLRSQGVDTDAIKRADDEETRKYAEPCRRSGGTWGRPLDKYGNQGRLGCYHPTGER